MRINWTKTLILSRNARALLAAFWLCIQSNTFTRPHTKRIDQSYNCLRQCGSLGIITQCSRPSKCWKSSFRHRNVDYMESVVWILCQCDMNVNSQILIHNVYYLTRQSTAMDMDWKANEREMVAKQVYFSHGKIQANWMMPGAWIPYRTWSGERTVRPVWSSNIKRRLDKYVYKRIDSIRTKPLKVGLEQKYCMCDPKPLMDESAIKVMASVVIFRCYFCSSMLFHFRFAVEQTNPRASLFLLVLFLHREKKCGKAKINKLWPKIQNIDFKHTERKSDFFLFQRYECNNKRQSSIWFVCGVCVSVCTQMIRCDLICESLLAKAPNNENNRNKQTVDEAREEAKKNNDGYFFEWREQFFFMNAFASLARSSRNQMCLCVIFMAKTKNDSIIRLLRENGRHQSWTMDDIQRSLIFTTHRHRTRKKKMEKSLVAKKRWFEDFVVRCVAMDSIRLHWPC